MAGSDGIGRMAKLLAAVAVLGSVWLLQEQQAPAAAPGDVDRLGGAFFRRQATGEQQVVVFVRFKRGVLQADSVVYRCDVVQLGEECAFGVGERNEGVVAILP